MKAQFSSTSRRKPATTPPIHVSCNISVLPLKWHDVTQTELTMLHVSTELLVTSGSTFHFLIVFVSLRRSAAIDSNIFIIISSSTDVISQTAKCSDHTEVCGCCVRIGLQSDTPFLLLRMSGYCLKIRTASTKNRKLHTRNTTPFLVLVPAI